MNFVSDNAYGVAPEIMAAIAAANEGTAASYGGDAITARLQDSFSRLFEREVTVYPVITGTAANALALASFVPPHGAVFCHAESHISVDECGAPEFFTHGAKLITLPGEAAKITPSAVEGAAAKLQKDDVHHVRAAAISLTQATERGAVYSLAEVASFAQVARARGMALHMDGARFANAVASLGCSPAELTWRAGVDVLSFGATKNGALAAEAVVFFDPKRGEDFGYRRMKSGHLLSKMRFVSAQLEAYITDGLWLRQATRANALALTLADGLKAVAGTEVLYPPQANAVFVRISEETSRRLRKAGAKFYEWEVPQNGRTVIRLVTSFATPQEAVTQFVAAAKG